VSYSSRAYTPTGFCMCELILLLLIQINIIFCVTVYSLVPCADVIVSATASCRVIVTDGTSIDFFVGGRCASSNSVTASLDYLLVVINF